MRGALQRIKCRQVGSLSQASGARDGGSTWRGEHALACVFRSGVGARKRTQDGDDSLADSGRSQSGRAVVTTNYS